MILAPPSRSVKPPRLLLLWESGTVKPTSPLWYLAAFLFALGSVMLATTVAAGAWDPVREATVSPVTEPANAAGKTLAVFTDIVQPDRDIACRTTGADKKVTEIPGKSLDITVDDDGNQWHLIGLLREGSDKVSVACAPREKGADSAAYAYATVTGYDSKVNTGKGIAILGCTIGAALAAYTFWTRLQRRRTVSPEGVTDEHA